jgi:hypothetical protein
VSESEAHKSPPTTFGLRRRLSRKRPDPCKLFPDASLGNPIVPAYRPRRAKDNVRAALFLLFALSVGTFYGYRSASSFARFESVYVPLAVDNDPIASLNRHNAGVDCELKSGKTLALLFFKDARSGYGGNIDAKLFVGDKVTKKANSIDLFINGEHAIDFTSYMAARPVDTGGGGWGIISVTSGAIFIVLLTVYLVYYELRPWMARRSQ